MLHQTANVVRYALELSNFGQNYSNCLYIGVILFIVVIQGDRTYVAGYWHVGKNYNTSVLQQIPVALSAGGLFFRL